MPSLAPLVERFPRQELAIHRLYGRDAGFRALCGDHELALAALRHWEAAGVKDRVREYRQLVAELEAEIGALLGCTGPGNRSVKPGDDVE
jgi:hypothetical protein